MKNPVLLLVFITLCLSVDAQTLFYRSHLNVKVSGNGEVTHGRFQGWMIHDLTVGKVAFVVIDKKSKSFFTEHPEFETADISAGTTTLSVIKVKDGETGGIVLSGKNRSMVFNGKHFYFPTIYTIGGIDLQRTNEICPPVLKEFKGTMVLERESTASAFGVPNVLESFVKAVENSYLQLGYTNLEPVVATNSITKIDSLLRSSQR